MDMEGNNSMTAKSWLSAGWATFRKHPIKLALVGLVRFVWELWNVTPTGPPDVAELLNRQIVVFVVGILFLSIVSVGYSLFCLQLVRGLDAPFGTVFEGFRRWASALGTAILYGLIIVIGCILLVVPGIIWGLRYCLAYYALMDRRLGVREALKLSGKITTGYKGQLFCVGLVYALPAMISGMANLIFPSDLSIYFQTTASLVGTCVLWPWLCCSFAVAYDRLSKKEDNATALAGEQFPRAVNVPPDVERDILSGKYSRNEIIVKYAMPAEELDEIYKNLERKA